MTSPTPVPIPRTPRGLLADERFNQHLWRTPDGKSFYQLAEDTLGADAAARLWWDAICLDSGRTA